MKGRVTISLESQVVIKVVVKELTSGHVVLTVDGEDVVLSEGDHVEHTGRVTREWSA